MQDSDVRGSTRFTHCRMAPARLGRVPGLGRVVPGGTSVFGILEIASRMTSTEPWLSTCSNRAHSHGTKHTTRLSYASFLRMPPCNSHCHHMRNRSSGRSLHRSAPESTNQPHGNQPHNNQTDSNQTDSNHMHGNHKSSTPPHLSYATWPWQPQRVRSLIEPSRPSGRGFRLALRMSGNSGRASADSSTILSYNSSSLNAEPKSPCRCCHQSLRLPLS